MRKFYVKHADRVRETNKRHRLWYKYGLTPEQYDKLFEAQSGACLICGGNNDGRLSVDHDHKTGAVRGLLCTRCNQGIGFFYDSPLLLAKASEYLN